MALLTSQQNVVNDILISKKRSKPRVTFKLPIEQNENIESPLSDIENSSMPVKRPLIGSSSSLILSDVSNKTPHNQINAKKRRLCNDKVANKTTAIKNPINLDTYRLRHINILDEIIAQATNDDDTSFVAFTSDEDLKKIDLIKCDLKNSIQHLTCIVELNVNSLADDLEFLETKNIDEPGENANESVNLTEYEQFMSDNQIDFVKYTKISPESTFLDVKIIEASILPKKKPNKSKTFKKAPKFQGFSFERQIERVKLSDLLKMNLTLVTKKEYLPPEMAIYQCSNSPTYYDNSQASIIDYSQFYYDQQQPMMDTLNYISEESEMGQLPNSFANYVYNYDEQPPTDDSKCYFNQQCVDNSNIATEESEMMCHCLECVSFNETYEKSDEVMIRPPQCLLYLTTTPESEM